MRKTLRRGAKGIAVGLSALLTAATLILALGALRLSWGPISLGALTERVETTINSALSEAAPGWRAELGEARVGAGEAGFSGAALRLIDLTLTDPTGAQAFRSPEIALKLDGLEALAGRVAIAAVRIEGSRVEAERFERGRWRFALDAGGDADAGGASDLAMAPPQAIIPDPARVAEPAVGEEGALFAKIIDAWSQVSEQEGPLGALREISVRDAELTIRDAVTGAVWSAPGTRFDFFRPVGGGLRADLSAQIRLPGVRGPAARLDVSAARGKDARTARLTARFENASAAALAEQIAGGKPPFSVSGRLSGEAIVSLDMTTGQMVEVSARAAGENVRIEAHEPEVGAPFRIRREREPSRFEAAFDFDPQANELRLERLIVDGGRLQADVAGRARLLLQGAALTGVDGALSVRSATVRDPDIFSEPLQIELGGFAFAFTGLAEGAGPPRLALQALRLQTPEVALTGAATALLTPPTEGGPGSLGALLGARADIDLALSDFAADRLAALWPLPAAPGGRSWVAENIVGGVVSDGALKARIGGGVAPVAAAEGEEAPAAESVDFDFRFRAVESRYLGPMTPITGGVGAGHITADGFTLDLEGGVVDLGEAGAISLEGSRLTIPTFEPEIPPAEIRIVSRGPVRAVLTLLDQEPLALPRKLDLDPATARGTHRGQTELAFPLAKALLVEDIKVSSNARLATIAMPVEPLGGRRASAAAARLEVDEKGLRLRSGDARLEGFEDIPIAVDWREVFAPGPKDARSRVDVSATLTAAQMRDRLGAPPRAGLTGEAALAASVVARDSAPVVLNVKADLDALGVAPHVAIWRKAPQTPGSLEARAYYEKGGWTLSRLTASAPGLALAGEGRLAETGDVRELTFSTFQLGKETDLAIDVKRGEEGALSVTAKGPTLDLRGAFGGDEGESAPARSAATQGDDASAAEERPALNLDLSADRVMVSDKGVLEDVRVRAARKRESGLHADLEARAGGSEIRGSIRPEGEGAAYLFTASDAGALLTALGLVGNAEKGEATIEARRRADGVVQGRLSAEHIVIKDAPTLADILSVASVVGLFDMASSGGISFTTVEAPFVLDERRLTIEDAVMSGPALGLALSGHVDREDRSLALNGTLSPAYLLNQLPGKIPVIGDLFSRGEGDGLISVSFTVTGPIDDPDVSVAPLSVLAPGQLKRIFEN